MRWGVRDEMTNEHMTTDLCMTELRNCQRLSMGPNFIYFGAQKYGYRPIPTYIVSSELALLREVLVTMGNDVSLLDKWYRSDFNAVPPVSILQPIDTYLVHFLNKRVPKLQVYGSDYLVFDMISCLIRFLRSHSLSELGDLMQCKLFLFSVKKLSTN